MTRPESSPVEIAFDVWVGAGRCGGFPGPTGDVVGSLTTGGTVLCPPSDIAAARARTPVREALIELNDAGETFLVGNWRLRELVSWRMYAFDYCTSTMVP